MPWRTDRIITKIGGEHTMLATYVSEQEEITLQLCRPRPRQRPPHPRTAILAACKLEVEDIERAVDATDGGRISCKVSCSPAAYPHHAPATLDELQYDLAHLLNTALAHAALRPANLTVLPVRKAWLFNLDCIVFADAGNVRDALFLVARAAMCDTLVSVNGLSSTGRRGALGPGAATTMATVAGAWTRTAPGCTQGTLRTPPTSSSWTTGARARRWRRDRWPMCVTLNLVRASETCGPGWRGEGLRCIHSALYPHRDRRRTSWMRRRRKTPPSHWVSLHHLVCAVRPADTTWHATDRSGELPSAQFKSLVQGTA
ncbi:hypothetical protein JB92DRAFT_1896276 [Gautieria morchelliformis]|nr:hypothetical protein JB92DRAFT_1896276 [Gautieria morchelliformis]